MWAGVYVQLGVTQMYQVARLVEEHAVFLTANGRISIAGITSKNVDYLADAMHTGWIVGAVKLLLCSSSSCSVTKDESLIKGP